jgi:hypothetical protein
MKTDPDCAEATIVMEDTGNQKELANVLIHPGFTSNLALEKQASYITHSV